MIVHGHKPYNAEPDLARLREHFITPADAFYVRCHGDIPNLDAATHRLRVDGAVDRPLDLTMTELRSLAPARDVEAVLQCAGNRRADLQPVAPTSGDPWAPGALGNAVWTGIPLGALLTHAGATDGAAHVAFEAADNFDIAEPFNGRSGFGVSIPMSKALSPDVLVAWAMNGTALKPEHGHPLRMIVPGFAGIRSPKWLARITVQDRPSDNHMQARDYRLLPPDMTLETADWDKGIVIDEMPVNAAICEPCAGAIVEPGLLSIAGYAIASRRIARVDVRLDDGLWHQATLEQSNSAWSWTFWRCDLDIPRGAHELAVRAWDVAGQTQPADPADVWNCKGYLSAAWHRVRLDVR
jgi:sulfite oxidase